MLCSPPTSACVIALEAGLRQAGSDEQYIKNRSSTKRIARCTEVEGVSNLCESSSFVGL